MMEMVVTTGAVRFAKPSQRVNDSKIQQLVSKNAVFQYLQQTECHENNALIILSPSVSNVRRS